MLAKNAICLFGERNFHKTKSFVLNGWFFVDYGMAFSFSFAVVVVFYEAHNLLSLARGTCEIADRYSSGKE